LKYAYEKVGKIKEAKKIDANLLNNKELESLLQVAKGKGKGKRGFV